MADGVTALVSVKVIGPVSVKNKTLPSLSSEMTTFGLGVTTGATTADDDGKEFTICLLGRLNRREGA